LEIDQRSTEITQLDRLYVKFCHLADRFSIFKNIQRAPNELRENLEFIGIAVQPEEVVTLAISAALFTLVIAIAGVLLIRSSLLLVLAAVMPVLAYVSVGWYPRWRAERARVLGMGEAPMLVSYMAMAMKVRPNLERAVQFAAENIKGSLGRGLRKYLLNAGLRKHVSVDEALLKFADFWGKWCDDLKRAIHLIRSSVLERSEARRLSVLDKALDISLQGMRERMQTFAAGLYLPTLMIYSIGVLLPLVLVAVLPVLSAIGICASTWQVFFIYCVGLPIAVWGLSRWALAKRPAAFPPPHVPNEANCVRAAVIAVLAGFAGASPALISLLGPKVPGTICSLSILWGITLSIVTYLHLTTIEAYELRTSIKRMEDEFHDSLVQLGNQITDGRPAESAFERVAIAMRGTLIADVFLRASNNIKLGFMGLRAALFDPEEGALKNVYSRPIHDTLRMLVDLIERSTKAAGDAVILISDHLNGLKQVEADIRKSLGEVVTSMRSVALFFAPLIAAVTSRLQGVLSSKPGTVPFLSSSASLPPDAFLLALGLYVVALVVILISYAAEIELGDDRLSKRVMIARGLPVAVAVFTTSVLVSQQLFSSIIGKANIFLTSKIFS
jgi:Flp pilus assembly protein TadB